jgi:hypothetical protein
LHIGYLRAFGVIRGPAEEMQIAIAAEFFIERQISDVVQAIAKLKSRASAATSYRKELERLSELLRGYANLSGRKASIGLQKKLDRAIAAADAKIAELTPKDDTSRRPGKRQR